MYEFKKITLEQQKVISNPIRGRIVYLLYKKAMTAKQLADEMEKSPGNVHYHVKKLHKHEIITLVDEKIVNGIVEKYYRAPTRWFEVDEKELGMMDSKELGMEAYLSLTEEEKLQLKNDLTNLLDKYLCVEPENENEERTFYKFRARLFEFNEEQEKELET
ncbi:ArsR/SmtB family transcription factor [Shouchella lonarensis]|uniref:Transcriptional regulator, ArsR family n=1 Tax=Shouchella lonarensis TaxID=1464122 RepID=A0A1G6GPP0_9BACI|nr:winged helix-turn-helix domain-containing protein [Shouchella lonarensis]SDB83813.1 transcriptional regulator, ArsR family [Shouchella lonarensis]